MSRHSTRQYEVLEAIRSFVNQYGYSPTFHELMGQTGIRSFSQVRIYIEKLEDEGLVTRDAKVGRSIQLVKKGEQKIKKMGTRLPYIDQRKSNSAETRAKKAKAGKLGMGVNALQRKHKSTRDPELQSRIEMVVKMAQALENDACGQDVIRHNRSPLFFRTRGSKVG